MNQQTPDDKSSLDSQRLSEPETLLFETSPYGSIDAIVEHDGQSVYFYLNGNRPDQKNLFGTRACWVRNIAEAPLVINKSHMKDGIPPMLPKPHCVFRDPQPIPEGLSVIWFEEGNGAALIETCPETNIETTLSVIPPWSGLEGFHGYANACATESPLAWPMPDNPSLDRRIKHADEFWKQFESGTDPFSTLQPSLLEVYDNKFGSNLPNDDQRTYYAIDGQQFPPRGMVQYRDAKGATLVTVGMSLCPQPAVEIFTNDPSNWRRIELAIRVDGELSESDLERIGGSVSQLASFPWRNFTWLGPGHTCGFGNAIEGHPFVLLVHDHRLAKTEEDEVPIPDFRSDPVNLLWMIPITESERTRLQEKDLTADEIVESRGL